MNFLDLISISFTCHDVRFASQRILIADTSPLPNPNASYQINECHTCDGHNKVPIIDVGHFTERETNCNYVRKCLMRPKSRDKNFNSKIYLRCFVFVFDYNFVVYLLIESNQSTIFTFSLP